MALRRLLLTVALAAACGPAAGRDLRELVVRDSTYFEPETLEPYTGVVFRTFPGEPAIIELRGSLREGTWDGELTIYHRTGRVRFQGEMSRGAQCGAWVENAPEESPGSLYEEIVAEIEDLSLYPECPG